MWLENNLESDVSCTLAERDRLRETSRRDHRRAFYVNLCLVVLPVLLALVYAMFIAAPRYLAETRFSVRSGAPNGGAGASAGFLANGVGIGGGGFVDGWAVADFLASRDCMRLLDRRVDLRRYLKYDGIDPLRRLSSHADEDDMYRAYAASLDVSYNLMEQINVMKVRALAPKDAELISASLLEIAQEFVNSMDDKGVSSAMEVGKKALDMAEQQNAGARQALTQWRIDNGNFDPLADASMLQTLNAQLETELSKAQINLDKIRAINGNDHPMLEPALAQVDALKRRLNDTRRRMSGTGRAEASQLKAYESLKGALEFADQNLTTARQNYQQAFTDTLRLRRYLSVVARPIAEQKPSEPRLLSLLAKALACGVVLLLLARWARGTRDLWAKD